MSMLDTSRFAGGPYPINCFSVNQDGTWIAASTPTGWIVQSMNTFENVSLGDLGKPLTAIAVLNQSNVLAFSGSGDDANQIFIYNHKKQQSRYQMSQDEPVRGIHLSEQFLTVRLLKRVCVYRLESADRRLAVHKKSLGPEGGLIANDSGVFAVCSAKENPWIAFPSEEKGTVMLFSPKSGEVFSVKATLDDVSAMAFNEKGTLLAVVSATGTLIHIIDVASRTEVKKLRRGSKAARVFGVAFNRDSTMLGCVSDHGTVHVFALDLAGQQADAAAAATPVAGDASPVGDAPAAESPTPAPAPALVNKTSRFWLFAPLFPLVGSEWSALQYTLTGTPTVPSLITFIDGGDDGECICIARADGTMYRLAIKDKQLVLTRNNTMLPAAHEAPAGDTAAPTAAAVEFASAVAASAAPAQ